MKAVKLAGSSMLPLFREGETAFYREVGNGGHINPGDCAVYMFRGKIFLHRVVRTSLSGAFFSNDDALEEHYVKWEDVLGRIETSNILKKGLIGLLFHKTARLLRKVKCLLRQNLTTSH